MSRASKSPTIGESPQDAEVIAPTEACGEASPAEYMLPQFIRIDDETLSELRMLEALVEQHRITARALNRELLALITSRCRVNLDTEHWELDSRRGLLERKDS